ncbi:hypothetical protein DFH29DRAFT_981113 [Suillus ampliporus]|nr:hypothetical protein DFH29DRAFT_981113 [Suillus ampliporus]
MYAHWDLQMEQLADTYLEWKHGSQDSASMEEDRHEFHVSVIGTFGTSFNISYQKVTQSHGSNSIEEPANVGLLCCGLLGCSPVELTVAIELHTLELYHRLRCHHPQLSVQAMARTLCDIHDVNYCTCYRDQFSIAFNAYLSILWHILSKVNQALGCGADDWCAQNVCPCCTYEFEDENTLNPKMLVSHDGNNSSKCIAGVGSADECQFHSTYFISHKQVDRFKNEDDEHNVETDENLASCLQWKSSGPDHKKTTLDIYKTTSILLCKMVKSGEL